MVFTRKPPPDSIEPEFQTKSFCNCSSIDDLHRLVYTRKKKKRKFHCIIDRARVLLTVFFWGWANYMLLKVFRLLTVSVRCVLFAVSLPVLLRQSWHLHNQLVGVNEIASDCAAHWSVLWDSCQRNVIYWLHKAALQRWWCFALK